MDGTRTARAIARRSDIFAEREGDLALRYPRGTSEGVVHLLAEQGMVLDGVALLLLDALSELYMRQCQMAAATTSGCVSLDARWRYWHWGKTEAHSTVSSGLRRICAGGHSRR